MPGLMAMLGNLVAGGLGFWIFSALSTLGVAVVAQEFAIEPMLERIQQATSGLPADALAWFAYLGIDQFITIVLSAYAMAALAGGLRMRKAA